jgi:hypothetical protein
MRIIIDRAHSEEAMARINLSIPDDLRTRMSALDNRFNWSEVAQAAFEREVSAATFNGENMDSVIERLRASKEEYDAEERGDGLRHGREWAKLTASFKDLRAISKIEFGDGHLEEFEMGFIVDKALDRDSRNDPEESLWSDGSEDLVMPINAYVEAFVEGAKQIWDEVDGKI